jgi:hypothetical protein
MVLDFEEQVLSRMGQQDFAMDERHCRLGAEKQKGDIDGYLSIIEEQNRYP